MKNLKYTFVLLLLLSTLPLFATDLFPQYPLPLYLKVTMLQHAGPPELVGDYVVFTEKPSSPTRMVGIAFASEDFGTIHPFYRNSNGVFFFAYPVPHDETQLLYRVVVDGLWTADPMNPTVVEDQTGIALSQLPLPARDLLADESPIVKRDGSVQFVLRAPSDRVIYLVGDFNNWDPFVERLAPLGNGLYGATVRVSPGPHAYYFLSNGTHLSDPLNPNHSYAADGSVYSLFSVP